jgi:hypothetical protein
MSVDILNSNVIDKDSVAAELFEAISHPRRIQILRILKDQVTGFAELKKQLRITSSGNLAHHLGKLGPLVRTNALGKYELADQGNEALIALQSIRDRNERGFIIDQIMTVAILWYAIWLSVSLYLMTHDLRLTLIIQIPAILSSSIFSFVFWKRYYKRLQKEDLSVNNQTTILKRDYRKYACKY